MKDPDEGCTPYERNRRATHRSIDRILDAYPRAHDDAQSRGWPPTGEQVGSSNNVADPTGTQALNPSQAVAWIAQLGDIMRELQAGVGPPTTMLYELAETLIFDQWNQRSDALIRAIIDLGNKAVAWFPPPPKPGTVIGDITVGKRSNNVELCARCREPVIGGNADPKRYIDGTAYHKSPCWYAAKTGLVYKRIRPTTKQHKMGA